MQTIYLCSITPVLNTYEQDSVVRTLKEHSVHTGMRIGVGTIVGHILTSNYALRTTVDMLSPMMDDVYAILNKPRFDRGELERIVPSIANYTKYTLDSQLGFDSRRTVFKGWVDDSTVLLSD